MTDTPASPHADSTAHEPVPAALAEVAFHAGRRPALTPEQEDALADATGLTPQLREAFGGVALSPLALKLGLVFREVGAQRCVATMPVEGNEQPLGLLHGGAHVVLAETLASVAASLHAGPGRAAVGIELSASHHRGAAAGTVTGTATAIHLGRSLATHEVVMTDADGRRLSTVRVTNTLVDRR